MKILSTGHRYVLANVENKHLGQIIQFIEKEVDHNASDGAMFTVNDGTTNEEVISVLIDRMAYLQSQFPCEENGDAIACLEMALEKLEDRTRNRKERDVEGKNLS